MWTLKTLKWFVAVAALMGSSAVASAFDTSIKTDSPIDSITLASNIPHAPHWTPHGGHGRWHWDGHRWHWIQYHYKWHHNWHQNWHHNWHQQNWHHGGHDGHGGGH
ncbi:TPA: VrrB [Legionella pneumophila]|uniref:VrrB n=1 Tax=Legionella pneumophila subsp. pneumophila (strain Philadelphia 1 / ATCC 33152 / DSM 7513) TaxID=272624 RepID=Q5ZWP7_LEGPH|nr:protein VrrB [Legionella pneumophila]WBV62284.1 VrrB [Legionella pneumophila 130b]AAU27124.1 VrrB [Legionella pneumophila subsp. pneumophila str. Philadelphia 1]AGH54241.1 VrrB [Legionella pneumophila subsp. pneumophila LPE509]AOU04108.1 VrrB [Legionella pneumophila]AOU07068.1 VrrB [Legionella pneumophila]